ncbi:tripartite tricarboxylate transporter permease [Neorhizobium galegae]|uniref:tripartite tricarboxylate transporter permease n=1 Tax=Neorhizobium galegae TaxID=399 RepID=UPI0006225F91|nr:tripartite tricarboxylate transporter permease [Neorhizobium galegae]MCQ1767838.1 tripartite tricarboxylate transporter permease [Neorhizobium galegae]MCQ1848177.1 tripartite tricarboxylate transporter permease [Neorhizobium galegae]CDZ26869.1 TTT family tricarboxylate transporter [Neorhizobium galegae bv. officinalis]
MDIFNGLLLGFSTATTLSNFAYCFAGVLLGTAVGVLPGLGPIATISMLLPFTFGLPVDTALIMLAGIFYGSQYGGSTTAILMNLPGEASSVVTTLDGHQMAKQGKAGRALAAAAIGSFFAGTVGTLFIVIAAPLLASLALTFGPAEYFSLIMLGLITSMVLTSGSLLTAFGMALFGIILGMIGTDINSGAARFTFGSPYLLDGLDFVVVATGIFGLGDVLMNLENERLRVVGVAPVSSLFPTAEDWRRMTAPILRGTGIGVLLGVLPGAGVLLASFSAYALEKKISKHPEQFGRGAIEGVAAPEAANNAAAQTCFIPMLTLGLPGTATMALMIGALVVQGVQPGPEILSQQPALFWGLVVSMWIGNLMLLFLNLPLVGMWAKLISVPYHFLFPTICVFMAIGVYSINNSVFDVYMMALFGVLGYFFKRMGAEPAPLILAMILGPMAEEYLRRTLLISHGDASVFFTSPLSLGTLVVAALLLLSIVSPRFRKVREEGLQEVD